MLDPNIGEAHAVLAQINADRGDFLDAESGFFFAISLEPNEPTPHHWYSILLSRVGRLQASLAQARRAYELDPASPILACEPRQRTACNLGQNDEARRFATLAAQLGYDQKKSGIEAAIAMRTGDWAAARRYITEIESMPEEVRPHAARFVDALADPKLRPEVVAAMRRIDPEVAPQIGLHRSIPAAGRDRPGIFHSRGATCDGTEAPGRAPGTWRMPGRPRASASAATSASAPLAQRIGMVEYWKQYGYPDACRAGTDTPLVCS